MDFRSVLDVASRLTPGAVLSVGRPNSLFQAYLAILQWPAPDCLRHASTALITGPGAISAFAQQSWPHSGYQKQIVAERNGRLLLASGEIVDQVTLDDFYGHLRHCAAIEVDAASWECLQGAAELIQRCCPMLVIERNREAMPQILALLDKYGYVIAQASDGVADGKADLADYLVALPKSGGGPGSAEPRWAAAPRALLAQRRHELAREPLEGWSCVLDAADLCLFPATAETHNGRLRWWTGPQRNSRLLVWAPAEGVYQVTVELAEFPYPPGSELTLTRSLEKAESVLRPGAVELTLSISRSESRAALPIALVTPQARYRRVSGRNCKVGVAISGLRVDRIGAF